MAHIRVYDLPERGQAVLDEAVNLMQATIMEYKSCGASEMSILSVRDQLQFTAAGAALTAELTGEHTHMSGPVEQHSSIP